MWIDGKNELRSLLSFALSLLAVALVWLLFLGWNPGLVLAGGDALTFHLPYLQRLVEVSGDFSSLVYDPGWMGGVRLHGTYGTPPIQTILASILKSPLSVLNYYMIFQQAAMGWLAARTLQALEPKTDRILGAAIFLLAAFSPLVAWRIFSGQLNPSFFLLNAALFLAVSLGRGKLLLCDFIISLFLLGNSISYVGYQYFLYSLLFAAPIAIALLIDKGMWAGKLLFQLALCMLVVLVVFVSHWLEPLVFFAGGEAARQAGQNSVISSAPSPGVMNWLGSLFFFRPQGLGDYAHEINLPAGPLLLCLPLLWRRGMKRTSIVFLACSLLAIVLSAPENPVARLLLTVVPPLSYFRCPARAVIFPLLLLPLLTGLALAGRGLQWRSVFWLGVTAGVLPFFPGGIFGELLFWAALAVLWKKKSLLLPLLLVVSSLVAFRERTSLQALETRLSELRVQGNLARLSGRELSTGLERVALVGGADTFQTNTAAVMGLPTLDGYWMPPAIHLSWLSSLGAPLPATAMSFRHNPEDPAFAEVARIFNVKKLLKFEGGAWNYGKEYSTFGPAWFLPGCKRAPGPIEIAKVDPYYFSIIKLPQGDTPCTLAVAANYSPVLDAYSGGVNLDTRIVHDVLLGIEVPAGVEEVHLKAESVSGPLVWPSLILGLGMAAWLWFRLRRITSPG